MLDRKVFGGATVLCLLIAACSSSDSGDGTTTEGPLGIGGAGGQTSTGGTSTGGTSSLGGASLGGQSSTGGASAGGTSSTGGTTSAGGQAASAGGAPTGQGGSPAGGSPQGPGAGGSPAGAGGSPPTDPFETYRQQCVDTINMYRKTLGAPALTRWTTNESCVDAEATHDGMVMKPHDSFATAHMCGGYAEDECPGYGDPSALVGCLGQMWGEKDTPQCKGCDSCAPPYDNCTDCSFFGSNGGPGCGHYLNMKNTAFSQVACGFWSGGWFTQDFQ